MIKPLKMPPRMCTWLDKIQVQIEQMMSLPLITIFTHGHSCFHEGAEVENWLHCNIHQQGNFAFATRCLDEPYITGYCKGPTRLVHLFAALSIWSDRHLIMFVCTGHSGQTVIIHAEFMGWRAVCGGEIRLRWNSLWRALWRTGWRWQGEWFRGMAIKEDEHNWACGSIRTKISFKRDYL